MVRYEKIKTLKESEKSRIYLMYDAAADRMLVEKQLAGELTLYKQLQELRHPYLPEIYDVQIADGKTLLHEEYINGNSLAQSNASEKQLSVWLLELCDVLCVLHEQGIIHRDVKPSNLLVGADGHIRLIDFDAAREWHEDADNDTRMLGTKGYAPPEQYGFAQTDARADIYAIGITWKQLLGDRAKQGAYAAILRKCTDLNPVKRYSSVRALATAWKTRRIRRFVPVIAACATAVAVTIGWHWYQNHQLDYSQKRYPEEELLFYTWDSDYIISQVCDIVDGGEITTMTLDIDGDGKKETLEIKKDRGRTSPDIYLTTDEADEELLFSGGVMNWIGYDFPIGTYMGQGEWEELWLAEAQDYIQVTCLDMDPLEVDGHKEILFSFGDREKHTVTLVYGYDEMLEFPLVYQVAMWGSTAIRQNESGAFEAELLSNPYLENNLYYYAFDEIGESICLDFTEYWNYLQSAWPSVYGNETSR